MCQTIHRRGSKSLIAIIGLTLIGYITACGRTILRAGLSHGDRQLILDMHNAMRQSIALGQVGGQPPATNMMEMKWDNELANRAQNWALSCQSERHDAQRHVSRFPVGQNIATTWTTRKPSSDNDSKPDFADSMRKWFNEFKQFSYGGIGEGHTGHYTQMIWAETNLVGCGYAFYYDPAKGFTKNYICNYGPGGNVLGQSPYSRGHPNCVESGLTDSRKYFGLCDKPGYVYSISNFIV
ncbi:venom allergen 3 [Anoplophora glabripennis]|uniref:venom allergen 3 n=1 Tax=Anoplophora glabripennis TaxID=217634 RepID=UPI0008755C0C|nr:venom allergen 3 [Anoplophora glabripennis]